MLKLFAPDKYISGYAKVNPDELKKQGIRVLVCDIDNTLVAHDEADPSEEVKVFLQKAKDSGLEIILISNNVEERVSRFARGLPFHVRIYPFAKKPLKMTYRKMMRDTGYDRSQIAVLGDQLLTDMLGANRMRFYTILTHPVAQRDLTCTKINRIFENIIFRLLAVSGKLKRGTFDDEM